MKFDIETYKRRTARLDDTDIDYDAFRGAAARRAPRCAASGTCTTSSCTPSCYLRDLLVTRAHDDPDITTFLTFWAYEEFWHGEAIGAVLAAHGEPPARPRVARRPVPATG